MLSIQLSARRAVTLSILAAAMLASLAWLESASAQTFTSGGTAQVVTDDGGNLNMRSGPGLSHAIIASLANGSVVTIRDGSQQADGFTWQLVQSGSAIGWVAALYLVPLDGTSPPPSPSPTPAPSPAPSPAPPGTGVTAGTITGSLPPNGRPSFVVWGGGTHESMRTAAVARGCDLRSVWATADGRFFGYSFGVPDFVNAPFTGRFGASLPPMTAVMAICAAPGQAITASVAPQSSGGGTSPASPDSRFGPPGPGGNE